MLEYLIKLSRARWHSQIMPNMNYHSPCCWLLTALGCFILCCTHSIVPVLLAAWPFEYFPARLTASWCEQTHFWRMTLSQRQEYYFACDDSQVQDHHYEPLDTLYTPSPQQSRHSLGSDLDQPYHLRHPDVSIRNLCQCPEKVHKAS